MENGPQPTHPNVENSTFIFIFFIAFFHYLQSQMKCHSCSCQYIYIYFMNSLLICMNNNYKLSASCIESGNFLPRVSGRNTNTRRPPRNDPAPITRSGRGAQTVFNMAIWGAIIPPILPHRELAPTAVLLISVGNISAVYTNTIAKLAEAPNFPINANVI